MRADVRSACHRLGVSEIEVLWARAPSLERLEKELARLLSNRAADDVLGVSHSTATTSSKQSRGIWSGASETNVLEYSALVLLRAA
jgi:hypothetical protein